MLPVCDHYCGVEARMVKSLQLQASSIEQHGVCAFDVTLDCEDGAPVGAEVEHANLVVALANQAQSASKLLASVRRVGARVHPVDHPSFAADVQTIVGQAGGALRYLMIPKVESRDDVDIAVAAVNQAGGHALPLHVLIESPGAVEQAFAIASHPRVQSVSFGLMDFVSAHGGAIPSQAMTVGRGEDAALDQFHHPLVVRAKLAIASACHAFGKVPSHCVVTEFKDTALLGRAARMAYQAFGYTRMWSIHPDQIPVIVAALSPTADEVVQAGAIMVAARDKEWGPVSVDGKLHDRASFRYFWQVLERAHQAGMEMPTQMQPYFDRTSNELL
ncbi:aldolase/citrate lyase family protein [Curvibacter sp. APW13]|uniref:HpcH/HpaI aldolase/citrate lyase family protein n=1 Tax=Curvibacter sp. APW13 TaxID=3077236 RepID=UPI0028DDFE77|nr:aldolase/citrate lyase family protein [Curvibacter sp. APW13]MDT8989396.1 aldolase/citrate lyase family protein [Curvibacter sp. APW13]